MSPVLLWLWCPQGQHLDVPKQHGLLGMFLWPQQGSSTEWLWLKSCVACLLLDVPQHPVLCCVPSASGMLMSSFFSMIYTCIISLQVVNKNCLRVHIFFGREGFLGVQTSGLSVKILECFLLVPALKRWQENYLCYLLCTAGSCWPTASPLAVRRPHWQYMLNSEKYLGCIGWSQVAPVSWVVANVCMLVGAERAIPLQERGLKQCLLASNFKHKLVVFFILWLYSLFRLNDFSIEWSLLGPASNLLLQMVFQSCDSKTAYFK